MSAITPEELVMRVRILEGTVNLLLRQNDDIRKSIRKSSEDMTLDMQAMHCNIMELTRGGRSESIESHPLGMEKAGEEKGSDVEMSTPTSQSEPFTGLQYDKNFDAETGGRMKNRLSLEDKTNSKHWETESENGIDVYPMEVPMWAGNASTETSASHVAPDALSTDHQDSDKRLSHAVDQPLIRSPHACYDNSDDEKGSNSPDHHDNTTNVTDMIAVRDTSTPNDVELTDRQFAEIVGIDVSFDNGVGCAVVDGIRLGYITKECTYAELIRMALESSQDHRLTSAQIITWVSGCGSFYKTLEGRWKDSVRVNLAKNRNFVRQDRTQGGRVVKGGYYTIKPDATWADTGSRGRKS